MASRQISRKTITFLTLLAVVFTVVVLLWFNFQPSSQTPKTAEANSKNTLPPEAWRNTQLLRTIAEPSSGSQWITSLAISSDGKILVSGSDDPKVKVWSLENGQLLNTLSQHSASIKSVAISPDGKQIASASEDKTVKLWELNTGKLLHNFDTYTNEVKFIAFNPDNKTLISVNDENQPNADKKTKKTIKIWDLNTQKLVTTLSGGTGTVNGVSFSPQKQILAIGSDEANTVDLWDLKNKRQLNTLTTQSPKVIEIAISNDGQMLADSGNFGSLELWNLNSDKVKIPFVGEDTQKNHTLSGNNGTIDTIAFSPDGKTLFTGSRDLTVKMWNISNGDLIRVLKNHAAWVEAIAITPDAKTLVTGSALGEIKLWQASSQADTVRKEVAENVRKLLGTKDCQECNLSGGDLRNFNLNEVDLRWANLSGANLSGTNLSGAKLQNAILFDTNLKDANLENANLEGANLQKANLEDAKLQNTKLAGTIMPNGKLNQQENKIESVKSIEPIKPDVNNKKAK
ncbi:pentapeptide repeat-containing protein [Nostoc sp. C117]|uniref:pentapeptide repeat-containing protein n=1 Tax=Nostoc sp. C117 TaxID=3349875 RepID=UPI00370D1F0B